MPRIAAGVAGLAEGQSSVAGGANRGTPLAIDFESPTTWVVIYFTVAALWLAGIHFGHGGFKSGRVL